jgi:hypothetical protein
MVEKFEANNKAKLQVAANIKARLREGTIERGQNLQPQQLNGNPQQRKISKQAVDNAGTQDSLPAAKRQLVTAKDRPRLKGKIEHDFWHSNVVKLPPSGDIYFAVPSEETCLRIRTSAKLSKRLKAQGYNYNDIKNSVGRVGVESEFGINSWSRSPKTTRLGLDSKSQESTELGHVGFWHVPFLLI